MMIRPLILLQRRGASSHLHSVARVSMETSSVNLFRYTNSARLGLRKISFPVTTDLSLLPYPVPAQDWIVSHIKVQPHRKDKSSVMIRRQEVRTRSGTADPNSSEILPPRGTETCPVLAFLLITRPASNPHRYSYRHFHMKVSPPFHHLLEVWHRNTDISLPGQPYQIASHRQIHQT